MLSRTMYSPNQRFINTVSTFRACDESREFALQVLPNKVVRYVVKMISLHILTFMKKLMYNPLCYHKDKVFFKICTK